ncbi:MAG TPA: hypothetical protein DD727_03060, partial [Clostridiales bacterium]|nr:hypothetical protein [Clostridiales bacterium]
DDAKNVSGELNKNGFRVTRLNSSGGFLKTGNVTLMLGVQDGDLDKAVKTIKRHSRVRRQVTGPAPATDHTLPSFSAFNAVMGDNEDAAPRFFSDQMTEITVGGATIFITNVEKFA